MKKTVFVTPFVRGVDRTKELNESIGAEPKLNCRFLVELPTKFEIDPWMVQDIEMPKTKEGNINKWADMKLELIDLIGPSTTQKVMYMLELAKSKKSWFSKNKTAFTFYIKSLDPTGVTVEEWFIDVKEIASVNFGSASYSNSDIKKIEIIFRINNCYLV